MISVLVMSCDKFEDTWEAFFKLYYKYFKNDYKTYICTEKKTCKYGNNIKTQGSWTKRVREALEQIDTEYVLFMLDDFFIRDYVDKDRINALIKCFKPNTAVFNFEMNKHSKIIGTMVNGFVNRQNKQMYLCSCQPSLWNRKKLIELLQEDMTPWEWETQILDSKYDFYINTTKPIIDIGYNQLAWGIVQGKWATEMIELNRKEGLGLDFTKRGFMDMKLSIITPYRDTYKEACRLLDKLTPQLNRKVEMIIVPDGCDDDFSKYDITVIPKKQTKWRSASPGRNIGLNIASGEYVVFIDSDDMVTDNYIETILKKCEEDFDYCYISWKDNKGNTVVIKDEPPEWNQSVWNCIYKRETIGKARFRETTQYGEELDFIKQVRKGKKGEPILEPLYIYSVGVEGGLTDLYSKGKITREAPIKAQIVMYLRFVSKIGGVETFVYEFLKRFHKEHDIIFLYDEADPYQLRRYKKMAKCMMYKGEDVECETYLNVNFNKNIADKVKANLYLDMAHTDYEAMGWQYTTHPKTDITICVSKVVEKALKKQYPKLKTTIIYNLLEQPKPKLIKTDDKVINLVSATRLSPEKGRDRMKILAKRLNERKIPFNWQVFTNDYPDEEIENFEFMRPNYNVIDNVASADYLVQLSNTEACPYAIREALAVGTPVISTNYPSAYELGVKHGVNGLILDMDMKNIDEVINLMIDKIKIKPIKYDDDTKWLEYLGEKTTSDYEYDENEQETDIIDDIWIVKHEWIKDEEGNRVKKGGIAKLFSSQRIRQLLEYDMIERKVI